MTTAPVHGRGVAFPPHLGSDGRVAWSSGPENVRESIRVILGTDPGERVMLPTFGAGLRRFLHEANTVATHRLIEERVRQALVRWEPRIRVDAVMVAHDPVEPRQAVVTVDYTLVATAEAGRATVTTRLEG